MPKSHPPSRREGGFLSEPILHDHPTAWRIARVLWVMAALLFVAVAVGPLRQVVDRVDEVVFDAVLAAEWTPAVLLARVLDFIGSAWVTAPLMVGVSGWLIWLRRYGALAAWVTAMIVSQLSIGPLKILYERMRPPQGLVATSGFSFPSGHSVAGATVAVSLVIVLVKPGPQRRNLEMLAAAVAVTMALSRVYLRAHWFSDVLAGAALGAAIAIAAAAVIHRIDERRERLRGGLSPVR